MKKIIHVLLLALLGLPFINCTDSGLQQIPEDEPEFVDNLLNIHGEYCTSPSEDMEFPVKILVVMDQSDSLQCTDEAMARRTAVQQLVADVRGNPSVTLGYLGFHAGVFQLDFTTPEDFEAAVNDYIVQLGPATDYQGVLSVVLQMLEQDMVNAPISLRARTKYVVMFVSDGVPEPRCDAGCEDNDDNCSDNQDNDGDGFVDGGDPDCDDTMPDQLYGVCNTDEEISQDYYDGSIGQYVDMRSVCPEYNMEPQILRRVDDLVALADAYGVGDLTFHTPFLFAPQDIVHARCESNAMGFAYVREDAQPLLMAMAESGGGVFQEVNTALQGDSNFLRVNYQPLESSFDLTETIGVNQNALAGTNGRLIDSDADGISDDEEFENSSDRFTWDTDNDAYSDLFEQRFETSGFDAIDGNRPHICCPEYGFEGTCCEAPFVCNCPSAPVSPSELDDRDGDGLNGAEERFLRTDERDPDTDGDRIPDGLEFRLGLDPTVADSLNDHDFDGIRTRDEIRAGRDPQIPDTELEANTGVRYAIEDLGEDNSTSRHCYNFEVNGIELVTTLQHMGVDDVEDPVSQGVNRIYLLMMEEPVELAGHRGNLFIGCVEATYLGHQYKDPFDGMIDLSAVREACYRSCLSCNEFENIDECRTSCLGRNAGNETVCTRCDEPCNLFHESEVFLPEVDGIDVQCVSSMCTDPEIWRDVNINGTDYFMCDDNCTSNGRCNCNCAFDCDCNAYRTERCSTLRACGR